MSLKSFYDAFKSYLVFDKRRIKESQLFLDVSRETRRVVLGLEFYQKRHGSVKWESKHTESPFLCHSFDHYANKQRRGLTNLTFQSLVSFKASSRKDHLRHEGEILVCCRIFAKSFNVAF